MRSENIFPSAELCFWIVNELSRFLQCPERMFVHAGGMQPRGKPTILVVEDINELRECLAEAFRSDGFVVLEANGAENALRVLRLNRVDAILSDVGMPQGSGLDLLNALKMQPWAPPIVMMTGGGTSEDELLAAGAARVFIKPIPIEKVAKMLEDLAAGGGLENPGPSC